jgi:hypothetical protein
MPEHYIPGESFLLYVTELGKISKGATRWSSERHPHNWTVGCLDGVHEQRRGMPRWC